MRFCRTLLLPGVGRTDLADSIGFVAVDTPILVDFEPFVGVLAEQDAQTSPETPILNAVEGFTKFLAIHEFLVHIEIVSEIHIKKL